MLYKARILTTKDFVPLVFPSVDSARKRLHKLVCGGYIAGYAPVLHDETRFLLDRQGCILLSEEYDLDVPVKSAPKELKGPGEHQLSLVRFWSRLVPATRKNPEARLRSFTFEWEKAEGSILTSRGSRPDAEFTLLSKGKLYSFHVELDRGTESAPYVRENKFAPFLRAQITRPFRGPHSPTVMLLLVPGARRRRKLGEALGNMNIPVLGRMFSRGDEGGDILNEGWNQLGNLEAEPGKLLVQTSEALRQLRGAR